MKTFDEFTNLYKRAITLRFKLEPVGVSNGKIVDLQQSPYNARLFKDETLQDEYNSLKPAIDAYHRYYIKKAFDRLLSLPVVDSKGEKTERGVIIDKLLALSMEYDSKKVAKLEDDLKKLVSNSLTANNDVKLKTLSEEKFLSSVLKSFIEKPLVELCYYFNNDTTSIETARQILSAKNGKLFSNCVGLMETRILLYGIEGKSVSIPYRCVSVNFPKFLLDIKVYKQCVESNAIDILQLNKDFKDELSKISKLCGSRITSIEQLFNVEMYPCFMTQEGIEIINTIIGRKQDNIESVGINQSINEYNQLVKSAKKKEKTSELRTLPLMKPLFDQILFGDGLFIPQLNDYLEVKPFLEKVIAVFSELQAFDGPVPSNQLYSLLHSLHEYSAEGIYVKARSVSTVSNTLWGDWSILHDAVKRDKNGKVIQKSISLKAVNDYIDSLRLEDTKDVIQYFENAMVSDVGDENSRTELFAMVQRTYSAFVNANIMQLTALDNKQLHILEQLMDSLMSMRRFMSVFMAGNDEDQADGSFYVKYNGLMDKLKDVEYQYNLIRNFFRRKPFNQDKMKLHFDKNDLLANWPEQEGEKGTKGNAFLFRVSHNGTPDYEYDYYLGIGSKNMFSGKGNDREDVEAYRQHLAQIGDLSQLERYYYYQVKNNTLRGNKYQNANGMMKATEADKEFVDKIYELLSDNKELTDTISRLEDKDQHGLKILGLIDRESPETLGKLEMDAEFCHLYAEMLERWRKAFAIIKRMKSAQDIARKGFKNYREVNDAIDLIDSTKLVTYIPVSQSELETTLSENVDGKPNNNRLYLFRISNKDLSYAKTMTEGRRKSRGKENLHTMYFRALMDECQTTFDIGSGEVFFRKVSEKLKYNESNPTHKAGEPIGCKIDKTKKRTFDYDLIKDKHYTKDTYLFHLSISQNYNPSMTGGLNANVNAYLTDEARTEPIRVIGIDRGERNLLYMVMLDEQGKLVDQKSFNTVEYDGVSANGKPFHIKQDYHSLLNIRATELRKQQKHWQEMDNIADLKNGYLSVVVHEIVSAMIDNHAIVVMEDLSQGFFGTRQKQLANVYQQFENMLEKKLSYAVKDKSLDKNTPGGLCNGYQLAQENVNGLQNGFIFYVPAWMTSKIDPTTGFVNLFTFSYTNKDNAKMFFAAFKTIRRNAVTGDFEFVFRYEDFSGKKFTQKVNAPNVEWTLTTQGPRIKKSNTQKGMEYLPIDNLTGKFHELFVTKDIDLDGDIRAQIIGKDDAELYQQLIGLFKLMMQMRNSDDKGNDYIISPVVNPFSGKQYNSDDYKEMEVASLPKDADANGAYNIARKGLMALSLLKDGKKSIFVGKKEWLEEAQKNMPKYKE